MIAGGRSESYNDRVRIRNPDIGDADTKIKRNNGGAPGARSSALGRYTRLLLALGDAGRSCMKVTYATKMPELLEFFERRRTASWKNCSMPEMLRSIRCSTSSR